MKRLPARFAPSTRIFGGLLSLSVLAAGVTTQAAEKDPVLYKDIIAPVLAAKCTGCHGEDKQKGKLRLDSLDHILQGSDGENVIPGDPVESLMTFRVTLPKDDDDVMPPEGETQLTANEIKAIEFWVKSGAKGDMTLAAAKADAATLAAVNDVFANLPVAEKKDNKPKVDPKILAARKKVADEVIGRVEQAGATLMPIAQDTPELRFSALNVAKDFKDDQLTVLTPAADQILWMDLARTQVTDKGLVSLVPMKNLTRLHLENTKVTDAGLAHLAGLTNLEYINLYGTQVTDAGLATLAKLPKLQKLFVWQSKVTDKGVAALAAKLPDTEINNGWKGDTKTVEVAAATAAAKPAPAKPAAKPAPAKPAPAPAKPAPAPAKPTAKPKPAPAKPAPAKPAAKPKPAPAKPAPAKPAAKPAPAKSAPAPAKPTPKPSPKPETKPAPAPAKPAAAPAKPANPELAKAIAEAEKAAATAKQAAADASANAKKAQDASSQTQKVLDELRKSAGNTAPATKK